MESYHFTHSSNSVENLYGELKAQLYASSHPFSKRLIIVPSAAMKSWLMFRMAEDPFFNVCAGVQIDYIESTLHHLFQLLSIVPNDPSQFYEPSWLELALSLEKVFFSILTSSEGCAKEWLPLVQYLRGSAVFEKSVSRREFNRMRSLASCLAKIFLDYGVFGKELIGKWKKSHEPHWQALLWEKLEVIFNRWNCPFKKFESFEWNGQFGPNDIQIHLFGLSFVPLLYHRFLLSISKRFPLYYYLLSPCQKFWSDTLSDKEGTALQQFWKRKKVNQQSLESLEEFLRDRNPLLANFGRLGREMAKEMESFDALTSETYLLPSSVFKTKNYIHLGIEECLADDSFDVLTILKALQADIALIRNPEKEEKIVFENWDSTIQVHAVPKKSREVQVIYDVILGIIDKHSSDEHPIFPGDIFVVAPNISEYAPFISSIFQSSESPFSIFLMDTKTLSQDPLIQGFLGLLELGRGRWEASVIMKLFNCEAFRLRQGLKEEHVIEIRRWVKETGIYWGKDGNHRKEVFKRSYDNNEFKESSEIGTWEYGFGRLLEGLAMVALDQGTDQKKIYNPINRIEMSQSTLLGVVLNLLRSLQDDLQVLIDGTEMHLDEWAIYLACLLDTYFMPGDDGKAIESRLKLLEKIQLFEKAAKKLKEYRYSFDSIYSHLKGSLEQQKIDEKQPNQHSIRFSSLLPMRAVPAKVVVMMGMGESDFPRKGEKEGLNLLFESSCSDYYPMNVDLDRYLFLEVLLSARDYLIFSYVSQAPGVSQDLSSSLVVKELLNYMDSAYRVIKNGVLEKISCCCVQRHSLIPFHTSYFFEGSDFKSYSFKNYLGALANYRLEKKERRNFLSGFFNTLGASGGENRDKIVRLEDFLFHSKNPLRVYLNSVFGIYIERDEERKVKDEDDIFITDFNVALLSKKGFLKSKEAVLDEAEKIGRIPQGSFKHAARQIIKEEIVQFLHHLHICGIGVNDIFTIELKEGCVSPILSDREKIFPPIVLEDPKIGKVKIIGRLENVSSKGIVVFHQEKAEKIIELWPLILVLQFIINNYHLDISPELIFIKGKKARVKKFNFSSEQNFVDQSLINYLDYYLNSSTSACPFIPSWVSPIFSGDREILRNGFKSGSDEEFRPVYDQYLNWLKRNSSNQGFEPAIEEWQELAKTLFNDIFTKQALRD